MRPTQDASLLADYVMGLPDFRLVAKGDAGYEHIGAVISDAVLQAGVNYRTVVAPRIERILEEFWFAAALPAFADLLARNGPEEVLNWSHPEKPRRLQDVVNHFVIVEIVTVEDLKSWLENDNNHCQLRDIKGIGPKTVDYLCNLVGVCTVAVDRHVRRVVQNAGIMETDYETLRDVVKNTADILEINPRDLDYSIWLYFSTRRL